MMRDLDLPPEWFFEDENYSERAQAFDDGFTHACGMLARMIGAAEWEMRDGTETWAGDARNTLWSVLEGAGYADRETGELTHAHLRKSLSWFIDHWATITCAIRYGEKNEELAKEYLEATETARQLITPPKEPAQSAVKDQENGK